MAVVMFAVAQVYLLCFHRQAFDMCLVAREYHALPFFFIGPIRINLLMAMKVSDNELLSEMILKGSQTYLDAKFFPITVAAAKKHSPSLKSLDPFSEVPTHICRNNGINLMVTETR